MHGECDCFQNTPYCPDARKECSRFFAVRASITAYRFMDLLSIPSSHCFGLVRLIQNETFSVRYCISEACTGAPIILGRCPSLSAHESESMLRTRLQRETRKRHLGETHSLLITAFLLLQRLSCYQGKNSVTAPPILGTPTCV
jgi:hypothetical protein